MKVLFIEEYLPQEMLGSCGSRSHRDAGHETKALFIPDTQWLDKLQEYNPDVVCGSGHHRHPHVPRGREPQSQGR
ncbi:MAG: hypothetical protein IPK67_19130 [Planctomycetes bacterium]|nr:hypothetical protein [Planctomycetota bacterium]